MSKADLETVKQLLSRAPRASLGTLAEDGTPYVSLVLVAEDGQGAPLLLLSDLAEHTKNLVRDARASLLVESSSRIRSRPRAPRSSGRSRASTTSVRASASSRGMHRPRAMRASRISRCTECRPRAFTSSRDSDVSLGSIYRRSVVVSYKQKPIEGQFDAIVIGSGIGGLAAAAILAKRADKRVLVLERHYTAGGLTQSFTRPGYEWDVGVHYIGEVGGSGALRQPVRLPHRRAARRGRRCRTSTIAFTSAIARTTSSRVRERFLATLKERFPERSERARSLRRARRACRQTSAAFFTAKALPSAMSRTLGPSLREPFLEHAAKTTADVIGSLTQNRELFAVLTAQYGNYGLAVRANRASRCTRGIVGHFLEGAYFPVGGAGAIAEALAPTIEAAGGAIYVSAEVERDPRRGRLRARCSHERRSRAARADRDQRRGRGEHVREASCPRRPTATRSVPSMGHVCLYLGFEQTDEELGLDGTNLWIYPGRKPRREPRALRRRSRGAASVRVRVVSVGEGSDVPRAPPGARDGRGRHGRALRVVRAVGRGRLAKARRRVRSAQGALQRARARGALREVPAAPRARSRPASSRRRSRRATSARTRAASCAGSTTRPSASRGRPARGRRFAVSSWRGKTSPSSASQARSPGGALAAAAIEGPDVLGDVMWQ